MSTVARQVSATTGPTPGTVIRRRHQVLAVIGGFHIVPPLNRICSVRDFPTLRSASFRLSFSNSVALEAKRILTALVKAILRILAAKGTDCRLRKQPREPVHTARDHAHVEIERIAGRKPPEHERRDSDIIFG